MVIFKFISAKFFNIYIYIYIYIKGWIQVTLGVILNNVIPFNNLLLNSYFKIFTVGLHVLYVLDMHTNIHANQLLFII